MTISPQCSGIYLFVFVCCINVYKQTAGLIFTCVLCRDVPLSKGGAAVCCGKSSADVQKTGSAGNPSAGLSAASPDSQGLCLHAVQVCFRQV